MKIKYLFLGAMAMCMAACSSNDVDEVIDNQGSAYMQLSVALPSASSTRSQTADDGTTAEGTEDGQDVENTVSSISVVLVESTTKKQFFVPNFTTENGTTYTSQPFQVSGIKESTDYSVYVIVNGGMTYNSVETDYVSVASADLSGSIAKPNYFLMTGVKSGYATTGADLSVYTKESPWDLGTIDVERAAARFDYKAQYDDNKYTLSSKTGKEVYVTLTDMALLNVSKDFYLFKRVSADGTATDWTINGTETSTNYVVDYNWANKTKSAVESTETPWNGATYYWNSIKGGTAAYTSLADLSTEDKVWSTGDTYDKGDYKIVTYATENTISAPVSNQVNGISTGVIFKGELSGYKFDGTNKVYILNNKVIGSWADVVASADPEVVYAKTGLSETEDSNDSADLAAAGFSRFTPDTNGNYNVYYYYWNRHNDNGKENVMGPMEFAVVRNNVYKLCVTEISKFGHPNDPTDDDDDDDDPDPDPIDPDDPDESADIYLKVAVKVLPWTVRVNNIAF